MKELIKYISQSLVDNPDKVEVNLPVSMTFRKVVDCPNIGVHSYFWRCTPRF